MWLDKILDNINKFGIDNITPTEKLYLDRFGTSEHPMLETQLSFRYNYYSELYNYDIESDYTLFCNAINITPDVLKETRANLLWDNIEMEDFDNFCSINHLDYSISNIQWHELSDEIQSLFITYWEEYYKF